MADRQNPNPSNETQLASEAAQWFEALKNQPPDSPQRTEFAQWLKRSPRNVHQFLMTTALDQTLQSVDPERKMDVKRMIAEARQELPALPSRLSHPAVHLSLSPQRGVRGGRLINRHRIGTAAALIIAAATAWQLWMPLATQTWSTSLGEQRTLQLPDGSLLQLNTHSRVRVNFTAGARDLDLLAGEALFKVAPDPARPFRVRAADSIIQAIGTEFNVYRKSQDVTVSVLEGRVALRTGNKPADSPGAAREQTTVLGAGEEAKVIRGTVTRRATEPASAAAWRQRRLIFRATPLTEVVEEFNRYNRTPRIRLEGLDGGSRHYTGTFDADDPESLALLLSQDAALAVEHRDNRIVIRPR